MGGPCGGRPEEIVAAPPGNVTGLEEVIRTLLLEGSGEAEAGLVAVSEVIMTLIFEPAVLLAGRGFD